VAVAAGWGGVVAMASTAPVGIVAARPCEDHRCKVASGLPLFPLMKIHLDLSGKKAKIELALSIREC
jgi:hypothetical protein